MSQPTIDQFKDWLRTMPAEEEYDYFDKEDCAFARFQKANGAFVRGLVAEELPTEIWDPLADRPWTYGALLSRLEAL